MNFTVRSSNNFPSKLFGFINQLFFGHIDPNRVENEFGVTLFVLI